MTQHDQPQTAEEFLHVWRILAETDNTTQLERLESQFPQLANSNPEAALQILGELSGSDIHGAKEASAIYARFVYNARREETTKLLADLLKNGDPETQDHVRDTIDTISNDPQLTPTQAARLITQMKNHEPSR